MRIRHLILVAVLAAGACGDSGETPETSAPVGSVPPVEATTTTAPPPTATTVTPTTTTSVSATSGACPAQPFSGTIERTAESETPDGVHVTAVRRDAELVSAYAYDFGTGEAYTVYIGDHEIDAAGVGTDTLVAPPGGLLATIFVFSEGPMSAGATLGFQFVPIIDTGGGATIIGFGAEEVVGSVTIVDITDDRICFEIDATDPQQTVTGVVSAEFARS